MPVVSGNNPLKTGELIPLMEDFYHEQKRVWDDFAQTCAMEKQRRVIGVGDEIIIIQYNPQRMGNIIATPPSAKVGCFLCELPAEQIKLTIAEDFLLLCNPRPIFSEHFTIAQRQHTPQTIIPFLRVFFSLARGMAPRYCLFFNGLNSGASIPQHLHFQAVPAPFLPLNLSLRLISLGDKGGVTISLLDDPYQRQALCLESDGIASLAEILTEIFSITSNLLEKLPTPDAPFNILVTANADGRLKVLLFFRAKPRPSCFYAAEPQRILVSPGSVEMGGCVITAREEDFLRLTRPMLEEIFCEVSFSRKNMLKVIAALGL
ncbi:MAG: DUF4922 domain-containing protein [Deltaproteobacteria bacterium]|nr:DUF4922 domain-containing protein [Deltaproteobacteria bacterium]